MAEDCEDKKKESLRHLAGEQAFELQLKENKLRPSPPCFARSLPLRGSREAADNFCRKNEGSEFFSGKGKPMKQALHFFRAFLL